MYDAFVMSLLALLLFGAFLVCVAGTFAPLFMTRSNMADLWPLLRGSAKASIVMAGIGVVLVAISSDSTFQNSAVITTTAGLLIWSIGVLVWVKARKNSLDNQE